MARIVALALVLACVHAQQEEGEFTKRERRKAESAQKRLERDEDDPEANEAVGRFFCLILNDWPKGLPFLEKAKDAELRTFAAKDRGTDPDDEAAQVSIGDEWWRAAAKLKGAEAKGAASRAVHWYRRALPKANREIRQSLLAKIDKHLKLVGPVVARVPANVKWTDTGLDLFDGERVSFSVAGKWCIDNNPDKDAWCDWKGYPRMRAKIVPKPDSPVGCLIAKVGADGAPLVVSNFPLLAVGFGGRLYLGPNNVPPENAPGELVVTMERALR